MKELDLDVDCPHKVADVLRAAARAFLESATELDSAWQDETAGKPWEQVARILEKAANSIDKKLGGK